ncbi:MAG: hypothetical protein ACI9UJ_002221 [bacterium]|jgi:hypothetical protein
MIRLFISLIIIGCVSISSQAQFDFRTQCASLNEFRYLPPIKDSGEVHSHKKATTMSAIIPGLGQVYNGKYWKVGLIYAAGAGLGYGLKLNTDSLKGYQSSLIAELDDDTTTINYLYEGMAVDKIKSERNYYRKTRDQMILGLGLLYILQIVDANVDAHLREFDVNEDLAIQPKPGFMIVNQRVLPSAGFRLRF